MDPRPRVTSRMTSGLGSGGLWLVRLAKQSTRGTDDAAGPITLAIDIGGTGVKMQALSPEGKPITERLRVPTPEPATTAAILAALDELKVSLPLFDRVSVGFPGVIKQGKTLTAANLDPGWIGFPWPRHWKSDGASRLRMANDCAVGAMRWFRAKGSSW